MPAGSSRACCDVEGVMWELQALSPWGEVNQKIFWGIATAWVWSGALACLKTGGSGTSI